MPTWLSDPSNGFYLLALVIVLVAIGLWVRSRDRGSAVRAGVVVGLVALLGLCDLLFESPREEAKRKVKDMGQAANARQWDKVFANVSDQFEYHNTKKDGLREMVSKNATDHNAKVNFTDFDRDTVQYSKDGNEVRLGFVAQISVPGVEIAPYYVEATFAKDPDGQFRMRTFKVFNYVQRSNEERVYGLP